MFGKIRQTYNAIRENGLEYSLKDYFYPLSYKRYKYKKKKFKLVRPTWQDINFKTFRINASAKFFLNPSNTGSLKEFGLHGFREPLNILAIFNKVAKGHPFVLNIEGNIDHFPIVELEAGEKKGVSVEPASSAFFFPTETLKSCSKEAFNLKVSEGHRRLKLYVGKNRKIISISELLLRGMVMRFMICTKIAY